MQDNNSSNQFYPQESEDLYSRTMNTVDFNEAEENLKPIQWVADEFVEHEKILSWYLTLLIVTLGLATTTYFLLKEDLFVFVVIVVLGVIFGVAGSRKPHKLEYSLLDDGIKVDKKHHSYDEYKSFSLVEEGHTTAIQLMPVKRFSPTLTLYPPNDLLDEVVDYMGAFLPIEEHKASYIDDFLKKIRF